MASLTLKIGSALSLIFLIISVYYKKTVDDELKARLESTLTGLLKVERKVEVVPRKRVAIGFGACLDVFADTEKIILLGKDPPEVAKHFDSISDEDELKKVFAYFFSHGAAGERYVRNSSLFSSILNAVNQVENVRWEFGGNAPVMASRLFKEGLDVLFGAQVSKKFKSMLPKGMKVAGAELDNDDVHILLEYPAGATWGKYVAPRANRFIIHSDRNNPMVESFDMFYRSLEDFKPDAVVIAGLQMMDNYPFKPGQRLERLMKIRNLLAEQKRSVKIHFEMASFSDESLFSSLSENLIPYTDSLGMNEQELPNLRSMLIHGNMSLISDSHPRVATVLDQMRDIFRKLQKTEEVGGKRKLSRLHVHTLAYQAIMTSKSSKLWKNTDSAAAKSSLTASRYICGSKKVDTNKVKLIMDNSFTTSLKVDQATRILYDTMRPVSCWTEEQDNVEICIAPVLVCTDVQQTSGGGDNISAAGLVLQI